MLWISLPEFEVPELASPEHEPSDPVYRRVRRAFSLSAVKQDVPLIVPRAVSCDGEALAAFAVRRILTAIPQHEYPSLFVDCRSSTPVGVPAPTYKLATLAGLSSSLCFALGGQAGTEVVQAITFLNHTLGRDTSALISAVQRVVEPDRRQPANREQFPLGDASATILVYGDKPNAPALCLRGVAIGQTETDWPSAFGHLLPSLFRRAEVKATDIKWVVSHNYSPSFLRVSQEIFPNAEFCNRRLYSEFNFGCADSLITLGEWAKRTTSVMNGLCAVCFAGMFGSLGLLLLELHD